MEIEKVCVSDMSYADEYGDDCQDYEAFPRWCGNYDTANFTSLSMCCVCGGGE